MRHLLAFLLLAMAAPAVGRSASTIVFAPSAALATEIPDQSGLGVGGSLADEMARYFEEGEGGSPHGRESSCASGSGAPLRTGLSPSARSRRDAFWPQVRDAACRHGLPPLLLDSLVIAESMYDPAATSRVGAGGLAQLMPGTARLLGIVDRYDPTQNLDGGARYLRQQLDRFPSLPLALAAYNAGPGVVARLGRIPQNGETPAYVSRILGLFGDGNAAPDEAPLLRRALLIRWGEHAK